MKRSITVLTLFTALVLSSCHSDDPSVKAKNNTPGQMKLDYYIESFEIPGAPSKPQTRVHYEYDNAGNLSRYTVYTYNDTLAVFEPQRHFVFNYLDGKVDKIQAFPANSGTPNLKYQYQYLPDARVSKITENNISAGVNSEANFSYNETNDTIRVSYTYSNGGSFQYEVRYDHENVKSDKTTHGAELCSDGSYTYDQHSNPFKDLGYVDYLLINLSANNKLTENVNYVACAFPSLVPEAYEYEYNEDGYPSVATTYYKSSSIQTKSVRKFFYKTI
jgi:hypothetical protein